MKLLWLAILFLFLPSKPEQSLQTMARRVFFQFESDNRASENLYKLLNQADIEKSATLLAYKGAARASMANLSINPATKYNRFKEGRNMIENAVSAEPQNAEVRFVRMSVQLSTPAFLGYQSDISADRLLIITKMQTSPALFGDADFQRKVLIFLRDRSRPVQKELSQIEQMLSKL